jgi:hypothetical protein
VIGDWWIGGLVVRGSWFVVRGSWLGANFISLIKLLSTNWKTAHCQLKRLPTENCQLKRLPTKKTAN